MVLLLLILNSINRIYMVGCLCSEVNIYNMKLYFVLMCLLVVLPVNIPAEEVRFILSELIMTLRHKAAHDLI